MREHVRPLVATSRRLNLSPQAGDAVQFPMRAPLRNRPARGAVITKEQLGYC